MVESVVFNEQLLEGLRPNFFELVANEAMQEALRPAFQYICKVLVQSRPDLFDWLWQFSDETYTLLESLLQLYFLNAYSGSFSEKFYSLRRVPPGEGDSGGLLGRRETVLSLMCLSFVPYLKVKLDRLFSKLQEEDDLVSITWHRGDGHTPLAKFIFFKVYPYISSLWQLEISNAVRQDRHMVSLDFCCTEIIVMRKVVGRCNSPEALEQLRSGVFSSNSSVDTDQLLINIQHTYRRNKVALLVEKSVRGVASCGTMPTEEKQNGCPVAQRSSFLF